MIRRAPRQAEANPWVMRMLARRPKNVTAVALANKNARIAWALMAEDRDFHLVEAAA
jgi:transposase